MRPADVAEALSTLVALGPRGTGTEGEARAASWTAERFRRAGLAVEIQSFEASRWPYRIAARVLPLLGAAALVLGGWWLLIVPAAAALAAIGHRRLEQLFDLGDRFRSANVIGRSPRADPGRPVLLLSAHLDAKTGLLPLGGRVALVVLALAAATASPFAHAAGLVGALALTTIALDPPLRPSQGALDDGSGMALLIALADGLPERVGARIDLVFLATGAEERGMAGALRFAQRHAEAFDRSRTLAINLDILGSRGPVLVTGSEGPFVEDLRALVEHLRAREFRTRRLPLVLGAGMDHQRLAAVGLHAISLTQPGGAAAWRVHTFRDRLEAVDVERLSCVGEAVVAAAERFASRVAAPPIDQRGGAEPDVSS